MRSWTQRAIVCGVLVLAAPLALVSLRRRREPNVVPEMGPRIEYTFRVESNRAADQAFQAALDRLLEMLKERGVRVLRVLPSPTWSAWIDFTRIDAEGLQRNAINWERLRYFQGLPLSVEPMVPTRNPDVWMLRASLGAAEMRRATDAAMQQTAIALHDRIASAHLCEACSPSVERIGETLILRLPWIDDPTERRMKAAIDSAPFPYPISAGGQRIVP